MKIHSCRLYKLFFLVINQPPFEVEESGWGEFETQMTIFFVDPNEKPVCYSNGIDHPFSSSLFQVIFYHHLKLFSTDPEVVAGKKPFINEYYDELVVISFDFLLGNDPI